MKRLAAILSLCATPALALDPCLIGVWEADANDIAHLMGLQMQGRADYQSGRVTMEITPDERITLLAEDLTLKVTVPGNPAFDVTVTGYSAGGFSADDGAWNTTIVDYDLVGSAVIFGERMTIPFTDGSGMFGGGLGIYGCNETGLAFESTGPTPRIPRSWRRVR